MLREGEVRVLRRGGDETDVWPARFQFATTITTGGDGALDNVKGQRRAFVAGPLIGVGTAVIATGNRRTAYPVS